MAEKFSGTHAPEQLKIKETAELKDLASRYKTEAFIIDGIDQEARENNRLVVEAIEAVGKKLSSRYNEFFGIHMGGSRIKGYNTKKSDIDLVVVTPKSTSNTRFVYDAVRTELDSRGVDNALDSMMGSWANFAIETDPQEFVYRVDHHADELITLFGYAPYRNANVDLSRLSALEIVRQYTAIDFDWTEVANEFAITYLGERNHLVQKFAERFGVSVTEVEKIFTASLFEQRYRKFGLEHPDKMYSELKRWYTKNRKDLKKYTMYDVYNGVVEHLESGL